MTGWAGCGRRIAGARFPWLEQACVTGAVPPPHRLRGRLRLGLGLDEALDAARKPYPCTASSQVAAVLIGWPSSPWRSSLQHRPPSPSARCRHEAADLAGGYPLRVVRIAPLHDAGITVSRSCTLRSLLCGRSYTLMHAEELRAGHARSSFPNKRTHHTYTFCSHLSRGGFGTGLPRRGRLAATTN